MHVGALAALFVVALLAAFAERAALLAPFALLAAAFAKWMGW